ncbi:hypothetical protein Amme3_00095 [Pseudomonas phage vB_PpuM-Amme-3]|uniref:Uncharacterized protein n=1 Tax=Pseudomonas phage vB_PpuM-Amme-3 TaxID=3132617 RepID=A0AAX4MWJ3_9CAUD
MQINFKSRNAARAFGKVVDNGTTAKRRWGVSVPRDLAVTHKRCKVRANATAICGGALVLVQVKISRRRGGAL